MTILDTNVLSALMLQTPDPVVVAWLDHQPRTSIWTTSVTVLEVRFGLQIMPAGKRRSSLVLAFEEVLNKMGHRVVPFDVAAARQAGDLMASRHKKRRPGDLRDTMIAGIVLARNAALATRNTAQFDDLSVPLIDPWSV
ncbi:MAG TPA: type II toxin-antitoxin system VapC family toxin [Candidatus Acidoferrales bacterium]|jgi:predicted nucleic acid-binding protein|nr:type II toxin-antitoxin system VapC family toxin [Candidatus Acidoferrales bacterium]